MITLFKVDGKSYDVLVTAIQEKFEVIEGGNSGTALYRQREIRDLKGIKIGHSVTLSPGADPEAFDELTEYLFGSVRPYVTIEAVHGQSTITYDAAYNTGSRNVAHIDDDKDIIYWDELTVDFRPLETQIDAE